MRPEQIHVFINRKKFDLESPAQSGASLKQLAGIPLADVLFLQQPGEDKVIANDAKVTLKNGDQLHSQPAADYGSAVAPPIDAGFDPSRIALMPQADGWSFMVVSDYELPPRGVVASLASGTAYLSDAEGGRPARAAQCGWVREELGQNESWRPRGSRIGFIVGEDVYLFPDPAYNAAQRMTETSAARLAVRGARLHRMLWEEKLLKSRGARGNQQYFITRAKLEGHRVYALHFDARTLGLRSDTDAPDDDVPEAM